MIRFVGLVSSHGTAIGVHEPTGALACIPPSHPERYGPALGFRLDCRPDLLFVSAGDVLPAAIHLGPGSTENAVLALGLSRHGAHHSLHSPLTGRYLAAPPIQDPSQIAVLTASRDRAEAWEHFALREVSAGGVTATVAGRAASLQRLCGEGLSAERILLFLRQAGDAHDAAALNAIVPLLGRDTLRVLATRLLREPELQDRLAAIFERDIWATAGLPDLARWLRNRGQPQRQPAPGGRCGETIWQQLQQASAPSGEPHGRSRLHIGPALDALAQCAEAGKFVAGGRLHSLPHACTSLARQQVVPHRTACIVMCARNEGLYLLEWLAYHRAVGFEHFFIYSNNNDDGSDALLACLAAAGVITWIDNEMGPGIRAQYKAYGHAFGLLPDVLEFDWALVADADEFFVPNPARFASVGDFLQWQQGREVDAIALNWKFLGSDHHFSALEQPMTRRNRHLVGNPLIGDGHRLIKTIFRPRRMLSARAHTPICDERSAFTYRLATGELHLYQNAPPGFHADPGFSDSVNTDNACIYHYYYKSAEEWLWKSSRNRGDSPVQSGLPDRFFTEDWIRDFMRQHDETDQPQDDRIAVLQDKVEQETAMLHRLPGVAEASEAVRRSFGGRMEELKAVVRSSPILDNPGELTRRFLTLARVI